MSPIQAPLSAVKHRLADSSCVSLDLSAIERLENLCSNRSAAEKAPAMYSYRMIDAIRLTTTILLVACFVPVVGSAQGDLSVEPYPAFVIEKTGHARCGPSKDFYRTDPLRHGQEVEVYAETDDGWLGIRPPADSFSWIPADAIELEDDDDSGVVIEDRTVAWIGTQLGRARKYRWQVQLAKGELVTVLGENERQGADGPQLWYRIVPPSGEYRWVHRDQVVFSSEELVASIRGQRGGSSDDELPTGEPPIEDTRSMRAESRLAVDVNNDASEELGPPPTPLPDTDDFDAVDNEQPIGSGVADSTTDRKEKRLVQATAPAGGSEFDNEGPAAEPSAGKKLLGALAFLGRPRLLEIGATPEGPSVDESPDDGNWVTAAGNALANLTNPNPNPPQPMAIPITQFAGSAVNPPSSVVAVAAQQPMPASATPTGIQTRTVREVSTERIRQIEMETRGASSERLTLLLSRLMAARATASETQPVLVAARTLASTSRDAVEAGRARLLAERADQYIRIAYRRDGEVVLRSQNTPLIPGGVAQASAAIQQPVPLQHPVEQAPAVVSDTGYLVQVYSARSNSPPFALTDERGRTIAYVTPIPGVNLRPHLNARVTVSGNQGFVTGLNTPHILASQAVRLPQ